VSKHIIFVILYAGSQGVIPSDEVWRQHALLLLNAKEGKEEEQQ
jgi:hypothetical protein